MAPKDRGISSYPTMAVQLQPEVYQRLERLSNRMDISKGELIRMLLKDALDSLQSIEFVIPQEDLEKVEA